MNLNLKFASCVSKRVTQEGGTHGDDGTLDVHHNEAVDAWARLGTIWEFSRPMMAALFTLLLSLLSMTFRWSLIVGDGPILICDRHFLRSSAEVRGIAHSRERLAFVN